ncbi:MAG: protein-disulfide reductase DsbD [Polynucleobacter sp.]|nr:protein-disulfide reductase DsbD [Polynucleobacter sp.]
MMLFQVHSRFNAMLLAAIAIAANFLLMLPASAQKAFLHPDKAFPVTVSWLENKTQLQIDFLTAKGYYLYQEAFQFRLMQSDGASQTLAATLPKAEVKFDETFQKNMPIYRYPVDVILTLPGGAALAEKGQGIQIEVDLQGCADGGICYPPTTLKFNIAAPGVQVMPMPDEAIQSASSATSNQPASVTDRFKGLWQQRDDVNAIGQFLKETPTAYLFIAFFVLGLALAFTPCVLPMLPILSSILFGANRSEPIKKSRAIALASAYIFGMALMYALAGVLMAALGSGAQQALQNPIVLSAFALLLLVLAGSLFGFYGLQFPQAWQAYVDRLAGRQKGGSVVGAFILGGISTLVASPCITAPLAGVLGFIAHTGSMSLGGGLLFVMALGMGLPLFLIAVEARMLIPTTGKWMIGLQRVLGIMLIVLAAWIMSPILLGNTNSSSSNGGGLARSEKQLGELKFKVIGSIEALQPFFDEAKRTGKPLLLDFYADWCISCKEMEIKTFANPAVAKKMQEFILVQADVTRNTAEHQALLKQYGLFGPPGILLFNPAGEEKINQRVVGFMPPDRFLLRLNAAAP